MTDRRLIFPLKTKTKNCQRVGSFSVKSGNEFQRTIALAMSAGARQTN
jgi:hypothetical protein